MRAALTAFACEQGRPTGSPVAQALIDRLRQDAARR